MTVPHKEIYLFSANLIKVSMEFIKGVEQKNFFYIICIEIRNIIHTKRNFEEKKLELKESSSLTSDYTAKLKYSRPYDTDTKTEI